MIRFSNVTKRYGSQLILSDVSLTVEPGEFVFLVGKSGSGKTTIMRLLTHQTSHDEGEIIVADFEFGFLKGKDIRNLRRTIGVIYQDYKLLPERTVAENIALGLEIVGKPKSEIESRIHDLLELIGLSHKAHVFPSQLSGGEAQRVCIARALATAPKVLFADEPTGDLDDETAYSIVKLLSKINELGTTILMATHNTDLVSKFGKRVLEIREGKFIERGKPTGPTNIEKQEGASVHQDKKDDKHIKKKEK